MTMFEDYEIIQGATSEELVYHVMAFYHENKHDGWYLLGSPAIDDEDHWYQALYLPKGRD